MRVEQELAELLSEKSQIAVKNCAVCCQSVGFIEIPLVIKSFCKNRLRSKYTEENTASY